MWPEIQTEISKSITSTLRKEAASSPNILVSNYTATLQMITFSRPAALQLWTRCSKLQFYYNAQWQNATPQLRKEAWNTILCSIKATRQKRGSAQQVTKGSESFRVTPNTYLKWETAPHCRILKGHTLNLIYNDRHWSHIEATKLKNHEYSLYSPLTCSGLTATTNICMK